MFKTVRSFTMRKYRIHNRLMQPLPMHMLNIAAACARKEPDPKVAIVVLVIGYNGMMLYDDMI